MSPEIKRMPGARGQMLDVELSGPADGRPLIFHNGTPMRGMMFESMIRDGADRGIRHIAYSRPGYAGSERSEGRTVADCAADVEAIADALTWFRKTGYLT